MGRQSPSAIRVADVSEKEMRMASTTHNDGMWLQAEKAPFEGFGILYYPVFDTKADLLDAHVTGDDLTWAMTAASNLEGTAYMLSVNSVNVLMAYHRHMVDAIASGNPLLRKMALSVTPNPLADVKRFVPDVTAAPMYPDYPMQVMNMSEAQFRYHQLRHYASTYGVEMVAGLMGLDIEVGEGWLPDVTATEKTVRDPQLVNKTVLQVVMDRETMLDVVNARLAKATRMHQAELDTAMLLIQSGEAPSFGKIAFHENMMNMVLAASAGSSQLLASTLMAVAQHPGDLLKAILEVIQQNGHNHLATRQKKAFCKAFEKFSARSIAENIVDAGKKARNATNYLSVTRFGGANLCHGIELVETGVVRSWNSRLEEAWKNTDKNGFVPLVSLYGTRPGLLLRSLTRLVKSGCDLDVLCKEVLAHVDSYSLPTIVRNLAIMTAMDTGEDIPHVGLMGAGRGKNDGMTPEEQRQAYKAIAPILLRVVIEKLAALDTPLKGKKVFLDKAGISLVGSVIMPNDNGDTGTAWPPAGIAYEVPSDKVVRFFTFWDDRERRVDVDLHFYGRGTDGSRIHVGWNANYRTDGMVTSGDITTSHDSVEYLDLDMAAARDAGILYVIQHDDIFSGRWAWGDIETCYSGAIVVDGISRNHVIYDGKNLLFRDDMTGEGRSMDYALIDVQDSYVRIMRGAQFPFVKTQFTLEAYLRALFAAQQVELVDDAEDAELEVCVGRSDKEGVISLFDEGFFIG